MEKKEPSPPLSPHLDITTFLVATMTGQLTDGQQLSTATAAFVTFDELVESLQDIKYLTDGDDAYYIDEVLTNRKFLVDPYEFWQELPHVKNSLGLWLPKFDYDGEVLTFKPTTDAFHQAFARKLDLNPSRQLQILYEVDELFSEFLKENNLVPTILPSFPLAVGKSQRERRCADFGMSLADNFACLVGEVC